MLSATFDGENGGASMVWGTLSATVSGAGGAPFDCCVHLDLSLFLDYVICGCDVRDGVGVDETVQLARLHCCHPLAVSFPVFGPDLRSLENPAMSPPSYAHAPCGSHRHHRAPPVASSKIDDLDHRLVNWMTQWYLLGVFVALLLLPRLLWPSTQHCGCRSL